MIVRPAAFLLVLICVSCKPESNPHSVKSVPAETKSEAYSFSEWLPIELENFGAIKPIFGYRFTVSGDFDGDGTTENAVEHYISQRSGKESNKYYSGTEDYGLEVEMTVYKQPKSFLSFSKKSIGDLLISTEEQLSGISFIKNEGDLNGDGGDELGYVISWADWSSCNRYHIATFRNGKWREIVSFDIRDWQLPDFPEVSNVYSPFGVLETSEISNDTVNERLIAELKAFPGFVRKVGNKKIRVLTFDEEVNQIEKTITLD